MRYDIHGLFGPLAINSDRILLGNFVAALHIAASEGHLDLCKFLIQAGAQINRSDRWGGTCSVKSFLRVLLT